MNSIHKENHMSLFWNCSKFQDNIEYIHQQLDNDYQYKHIYQVHLNIPRFLHIQEHKHLQSLIHIHRNNQSEYICHSFQYNQKDIRVYKFL